MGLSDGQRLPLPLRLLLPPPLLLRLRCLLLRLKPRFLQLLRLPLPPLKGLRLLRLRLKLLPPDRRGQKISVARLKAIES